MNVELLTKDDLQEFRRQLLTDIKDLLNAGQPKKWLKTKEVMALLDLSEVTLNGLRANGTIPFKKLGGICYYNADDIETAMKNL